LMTLSMMAYIKSGDFIGFGEFTM